MTRRSRFLIVATTLACFTLAGSATAGEPRPEAKAADDLYKSAKAAMDRGDLATACTEFAESQKLDPAVGTLLNLGVCESKMGKYAQAYNHVQEARGKLPVGDYRIAFADQKLAELTGHIAHLSVRPAAGSGDMHLVRDDVELTAAQYGVSVVVDPGQHVCIARAQGRADTRVEFTLQEGETRTIELAPGPRSDDSGSTGTTGSTGSASSSSKDTAPPAGESPSSGSSKRTWGLVLGTAGVVGLGIGAAAALTAKGTYNDALTHCPTGANSCDPTGVSEGQDAHNQATVATIAFAGGAALAITGAVLFFTAPKSGNVSVAPAVGANTAGLTLRGGW